MRPNDSTPPRAEAAPEPVPADRLDSWKEIAAFLQRDVRTVQRWEKQAGLPVHRHAESRLRTAFAYRSELEAWWREQDAAAVGGVRDDKPTQTAWPWRRRAVVVTAGAVLAAAAIAVSSRITVGHRQTEPAPPFPPVTVLLTRFDDQVGDPGLAAMLEEVVAREFGRHPGLEPVAPTRVTRTLRLMRRGAGTVVTPALGREIALREGAVPFVITGKLHKLQSRYFMDLEAIAPADGRVRVSMERDGANAAQLLASVSDEAKGLAAAVLAAAGPGAAQTEALEPVTTASLPALRLYTAAVQAGIHRQWRASEMLARRAIASDEQFASAHAWVGWTMRQQGYPASECLPVSSRGLELAQDITDRESYFIAATHHAIAGNLPAAIAAYEALLRLHARDRLAVEMLIAAYSRAGRVKEAADLSVVRAESDPHAFYPNVRAAHALTVWHTDERRASHFVRRAEDLASRSTDEDRPTWGAWLTGLPVFHRWLAGESREALESLARLEGSLNGRLGRERDAYATMVGFSYLAFGRIAQSGRAFRHAASPVRQLNLAMQALALGDDAQARRWLLQIRQHSSARPAMFARVGLLTEAKRGLDAMPLSEHAEGVVEVTRGLTAARQGQTGIATASLRRGVELLRFSGEPEYFLATEALARIWITGGETDRAISLLNDAVGQRARTYGAAQWTGSYWIKLHADLAAYYRRLGHLEDGRRLKTTLQTLLTDADADHPFTKAIATARYGR